MLKIQVMHYYCYVIYFLNGIRFLNSASLKDFGITGSLILLSLFLLFCVVVTERNKNIIVKTEYI